MKPFSNDYYGFMTEFTQEVANNIHEVEEFGDLPESLYKRLSQILSKQRAITSRTLDLFLKPDRQTIDIYDCGSKSSKCHREMLADRR